MKAAVLKGTNLQFSDNQPEPEVKPGWARIRITLAGICSTDQELIKGYMGFQGVLGHEFVGVVDACDDKSWVGKRVVGEINAACGNCDYCARNLGRHCPNRTVLGILNHNGCMAEYCCLPKENLLEVPPELSDEQAVFTEPISAAYEILDQLDLSSFRKAVVLGDGKLGILVAWVLAAHMNDVTLAGKHLEKLERAAYRSLKTSLLDDLSGQQVDLVVDATGKGGGFTTAMELCEPRGTIVLKSTVASQGDLNLAPIVINEINVVGSRCGRFAAGLPALVDPGYPVETLVDGTFPLEQVSAAFETANSGSSLKILLKP